MGPETVFRLKPQSVVNFPFKICNMPQTMYNVYYIQCIVYLHWPQAEQQVGYCQSCSIFPLLDQLGKFEDKQVKPHNHLAIVCQKLPS